MRRFDPAGQVLPADKYVFGTEIATRVTNFKRAWNTAVLKAHGHKPAYTATANLTEQSRAGLATVDLHFHDLRREAGSRWLEGGVPLHRPGLARAYVHRGGQRRRDTPPFGA